MSKQTEGVSGEHLAVMRRWIQQRAINGSTVLWGSEEPLRFSCSPTVAEMEELAQRIAAAVLVKR